MSKRLLGFEDLESRRVCAGNVQVQLAGHDVVITGDAAANYVDIQQIQQGNQTKWVVTGKSFAGRFNAAGDPIQTGPATTINGKTTPFVAAAQLYLTISTKGGNDAIVLGGGPKQAVTQRLIVDTGAGSDYAKIKNAGISASIATASFEMTDAPGTSAAGLQEAGNDKLVIDSFFTGQGHVGITTGGGADTVLLSNINTITDYDINTGHGSDKVALTNVNVLSAEIYMGASADKDRVTIKSFEAYDLLVDMGAGNDDLLQLLANVKVHRKTTLSGGKGTGDDLQLGATVELAGRRIVGMEE